MVGVTVSFNGKKYIVNVRKRPFLDEFLAFIAGRFEVVLFTASQKAYADQLLDRLDPYRNCINHRLFREACLLVEGNYVKDLTVLGRDQAKTVLVDNSPHAYGYQPNNGIPIESWYDDPADTELLKLLEFLQRLEGVTDVQPIIRDHFKTYEMIRDSQIGKRVSLATPPF